jgi:hypothetical protein
MSVLIVGADHLGSIPKELKKIGVYDVTHISGRNRNVIKRGMPMTMDLIIVLHDYVNHNLMHVTKKLARESNIPVVFARRSWSSIYKRLSLLSNPRLHFLR